METKRTSLTFTIALSLLALAAAFTLQPEKSAAQGQTHSQMFSYTGSNQTFTVPTGVTRITAKVYGAGGGGGVGAYAAGPGGPGGATEGPISVTPGQQLTVIVGEGGRPGGSATYGGGASGGSPGGGSGGGRSAIRSNNTDVLVSGGGGGGGAGAAAAAFGFSPGYDGGYGGSGNQSGDDGNFADVTGGATTRARGGSLSAPGAGGNKGGESGSGTSGGKGGDGSYGAGGGGGGYYGGGGGPVSVDKQCAGQCAGGGGGGSGFCAASVTSCQSSGFGGAGGKGGEGMGSFGAPNGGTPGSNGRVEITWNDAAPPPPPSTPTPAAGPQCSVTFDKNPITPGGSATIRWTSSNAEWMYINSIGYVQSSGSATVAPSQTQNYDGSAGTRTGSNTEVSCPATLTVTSAQCTPTYSCQGNGVKNSCTGGVALCPAGYTCSHGVCVAEPSRCSPTFLCKGSDLYRRSAQCSEEFMQACVWGCASGECLVPPPPSGALTARPLIVKVGDTSQISWTTQNVRVNSCTVSENNPQITDAWSGESGTTTTSALIIQTIYTLSCTDLRGALFTKSVTVNLVPIFREL